jgi:hypothetical protein
MHVNFYEVHGDTFVLKVIVYAKEFNSCLAFRKFIISGLGCGDCGKQD